MSYKVGNYGLVNLNLQLMSFLVWGAEQQPHPQRCLHPNP